MRSIMPVVSDTNFSSVVRGKIRPEPQLCEMCGAVLANATGYEYEAALTDPTCTEKTGMAVQHGIMLFFIYEHAH